MVSIVKSALFGDIQLSNSMRAQIISCAKFRSSQLIKMGFTFKRMTVVNAIYGTPRIDTKVKFVIHF